MKIELDIDLSFQRHLIAALNELAGYRRWNISFNNDGGYLLEWDPQNDLEPIDYNLVIDVAKNYEKAWNDTQYQRDRKPEYPSLADFADAYYWAQKGDNTKMTEYVAKCDDIKQKYPKPESM